MKRFILLAIGVTVLFQACSPEPVYRLTAETDDNQTSYYQGVEYIYLQKDSIIVTVSYYEHFDDLFALEVGVLNNSDNVIRVIPDSFAYKAYTGNSPEELTRFLAQRQAKNPEQKLLDIDLALAEQEANQKTDEVLFYTLQGLTLAGGIANGSEQAHEETEEQLNENAIDQEIDRSQYRYNRNSLQESRNFWQTDALRISDLWPGESVRGLIFFENRPKAHLYNIIMPVGNFHFSTWFRQKKYH